jgi:hypothetical protein
MQREALLNYSSPLFTKMVERVRVVMNEHIITILSKADRHFFR